MSTDGISVPDDAALTSERWTGLSILNLLILLSNYLLRCIWEYNERVLKEREKKYRDVVPTNCHYSKRL